MTADSDFPVDDVFQMVRLGLPNLLLIGCGPFFLLSLTISLFCEQI